MHTTDGRRLGSDPGHDQRPYLTSNHVPPGVVVWFEDSPPGHAALHQAAEIARAQAARLTVLTVATHERVIGCGRCLQGTVIWNMEMKKMAQEDLLLARRLLADQRDVSYETVVGDPAAAITEVAKKADAQTIVVPWQRNRRLDPPYRRNVAQRVVLDPNVRVISGRRPLAA